jgi:hypothetical protein
MGDNLMLQMATKEVYSRCKADYLWSLEYRRCMIPVFINLFVQMNQKLVE